MTDEPAYIGWDQGMEGARGGAGEMHLQEGSSHLPPVSCAVAKGQPRLELLTSVVLYFNLRVSD